MELTPNYSILLSLYRFCLKKFVHMPECTLHYDRNTIVSFENVRHYRKHNCLEYVIILAGVSKNLICVKFDVPY